MEHDLKCWGGYFDCLADETKPFEVRQERDRHFEVGDTLLLREFDPDTQAYSGRVLRKKVTYILRGAPFLPEHIAVMGLERGNLNLPHEPWQKMTPPTAQA